MEEKKMVLNYIKKGKDNKSVGGRMEIKFNHNYRKLHGQKKARLVWIGMVNGKNLSKKFIEYDTDGKYKIDRKQDYIFMIFLGKEGIPFTTVRKLNRENRNKYFFSQDVVFDVIVEE